MSRRPNRSMMLAITLTPCIALPSLAQSTQPAKPPTSQPTSQPDRARPSANEARGAGAAYVNRIERAHGGTAWDEKKAIKAGISLEFGGNRVFEGTMMFDRHLSKSRIELDGGATLVFDGEKAWVSPSSAQVPQARFHLLTWPYFLAAPFKLDDPGANVEFTRQKKLGEKTFQTAKLTFDPGTGDAPDDWYLLYANPADFRLHAMAYIVTYGTPTEKAEEEPHAIVYEKYETIDGMTLSTEWLFYNWSEERGIFGDPIGKVTLRDIAFIEPTAEMFTKPEDAKEDELPTPPAGGGDGEA